MKQFNLFALCVLLIGCGPMPGSGPKTESSSSTDSKPAASSPAPAAGGGTGVVMPGGPGGGLVVGDLSAPVARSNQSAQSAPAPVAANATPTAPAAPQAPGKLVDAKEALKNPKVVVASTKITGEDPLTASMQAYFSVPAKAQLLNFKHQVDISRQLNDGKPLSFEQFMGLVKEMKIEFLHLPPWQMIGYDIANGELVLLEDKGEKISRYKASNIPLDEGDKQYDTP